MRISFFLSAMAACLIAGAAMAETKQVTVKRNTATVIGTFVSYFPDECIAAGTDAVSIGR